MCKFYEENFKILLRNMKEDLSKIKNITLFLARFSSQSRKTFIFPNQSLNSKQFPLKYQQDFFLIATVHKN